MPLRFKNKKRQERLEKVPLKTKEKVAFNYDVADKIIELLKKKEWTQKMLAEKMGKHESEISKWVSGIHNFTIDTIMDISDVLGEKVIGINRDKQSNSMRLLVPESQNAIFKSEFLQKKVVGGALGVEGQSVQVHSSTDEFTKLEVECVNPENSLF